MTLLHLSRHGETVWHAENRYAGSSDIALTDLGERQAEDLGRWAGARPLSAIYSSDLSRAIVTARPAERATGLVATVDPRLREVHFGAGEGMTTAELRERYPAERRAFEERPAQSPLPDGETGLEAIARAWPALLEIAAAHEGGEVLVVMHSSLMRLLLCSALGIEPDRYRTVFPSVLNAGITTLDVRGDSSAFLSFNASTGS